jgi:5-methyltetrahydrofolate--homocysteine methyltransferase
VLATVYGDVHDIGKNLVGSILKSQGFRVIDLGKQVPVETIMETVLRERPDAIGLSALLVTTSREMRRCVEACGRQGLDVPIIIGGAAVNREFSQRICRTHEGKSYEGGVFYAKDAFEAVHILDDLKKNKPQRPVAPANDVMDDTMEEKLPSSSDAPEELTYGELLVPPFWGTNEVLRWDARLLLDSIDTTRLFKGQWGGGNLPAEEFSQASEKTFSPAFMRLKEAILREALLDARGLYGFFSVYSIDDKLYILDPGDFHKELATFVFPRLQRKQANKGQRSIADYFKPEGDLIAIQAVTIGEALGEQSRSLLQKENRYSDGFFLNGIGNYLTEDLARRVTAEIQRGLMLPRERGRRYSFGYPGLPGLEEQVALLDILNVEDRLGITLTSGCQMQPEHSTIGIFVHHPKAEYF